MLAPPITLSKVTVSTDCSRQTIHCDISIAGQRNIATRALIDTGAGGTFIDKAFAKRNGITLKPLIRPFTVFNVDHTPNKEGQITHYTWLDLNVAGVIVPTRLYASGLGGENVIIGYPWLKRVDPEIEFRNELIHIDPGKIQPEPCPLLELRTLRQAKLKAEQEKRRVTIEDITEEPTLETVNISHTGKLLEDMRESNVEDVPQSVPQEKEDDENQEPLEFLEDDTILIGYIKGESVVGVFAPDEPKVYREPDYQGTPPRVLLLDGYTSGITANVSR